MSFKSLVRSTVLIGSSSAATTLVSIIRVKLLAMTVGPAGVGLLGVLTSLSAVGTTLSAVGSDSSGTRRLALERDDDAAIAHTRRALLLIALLHGAIAATAFYLFRAPLARLMLGNEDHAFEIGLLGVVVAFSLVAGLQIAQLQGLGRVRDIARINIVSSLIGSVLGLGAVWMLGVSGLILLIVAQPALAALLALCETSGIASKAGGRISLTTLSADWKQIVVAGAPYMLSFVVLAAVPLALRSFIVTKLGIEEAGHFHAAWTMSVIYVGFLLNAMSADFFPRLTAIAGDRDAASQLINDQARLGLAIGGVALLVILSTAPIIVPLLYSRAFEPAVQIVEWQALGNLMKIAGWPVAFLSMARGRSVQFFLIELAWSLVLVGLVWVGLPMLGLVATGIAFSIACGFFFLLQTVVAARTYGFAWQRETLLTLMAFVAAGALTFCASAYSLALQLATGGTFALLLGISSLRFVFSRLDPSGRISARVHAAFRRVGWPMGEPIAERS
ncbi:MAG: oligosaccharide flippase family protein [Proteobacteria bacterium]|nr:oligosaccharide flippase family protein [Pseudomonadota bacterium]